MEEQSNTRKKVDFVTFGWAISIILAAIVILFTMTIDYQKDISDVKVELKGVSTDVGWIKEKMQEVPKVIKDGAKFE